MFRNYLPENIAEQAQCVYRDILLDHRRRLGVDDDAPTFLVFFADLPRALADRSLALALCHELAKAGAHVTVHIEEEPVGYEVDQAPSGQRVLGRGNRIDFSGRRRRRVCRRFLRYRFVDGFPRLGVKTPDAVAGIFGLRVRARASGPRPGA